MLTADGGGQLIVIVDLGWLAMDSDGWAYASPNKADAVRLVQVDSGGEMYLATEPHTQWLTMAMTDFGDKAWVGFFPWISCNPWTITSLENLVVAGSGGYAGATVGYWDWHPTWYLGDVLQDDVQEIRVQWDSA